MLAVLLGWLLAFLVERSHPPETEIVCQRERERACVFVCVCVCACACPYIYKRERERASERYRDRYRDREIQQPSRVRSCSGGSSPSSSNGLSPVEADHALFINPLLAAHDSTVTDSHTRNGLSRRGRGETVPFRTVSPATQRPSKQISTRNPCAAVPIGAPIQAA